MSDFELFVSCPMTLSGGALEGADLGARGPTQRGDRRPRRGGARPAAGSLQEDRAPWLYANAHTTRGDMRHLCRASLALELQVVPTGDHSTRKAITGSTRAARRTGR